MPEIPGIDKRAVADEEVEHLLVHLEESGKKREPHELIWQETLRNWMTRPHHDVGNNQLLEYPHLGPHDMRSTSGRSILKDPESNIVVETLVAEKMTALFGEPEFVKTQPRGIEDAQSSRVATALLRYAFGIEGHFRTMNEWERDATIFGTGIIEGGWHYEEQLTEFREIDATTGIEVAESFEAVVPSYDDYRMRPVSLWDCFPDLSKSRIQDMYGFAKRFHTNARAARTLGDRPGYNKSAIEEAIRLAVAEDSRTKRDRMMREGLDLPEPEASTDSEHIPLIGYVYYGEVPYSSKDGFTRRRVEVLGGQLIRSQPFAGRIPFFENTMNPKEGRFYGVGPLEVIRYSQDFADTLTMLIADGAKKGTHPPWKVQRGAGVNLEKLLSFNPNVAVLMDNLNAAELAQYRPDLAPAMQMLFNLKSGMETGSGTPDLLRGLGLGTKRASASEFAGSLNQAKGRPEAQNMLTEREYLPPIARHVLKSYAMNLEDSAALMDRVGEIPGPVALAMLQNEFDVEFVGSRNAANKLDEANGYRELFQLAQTPFAAFIPWPLVIQRFLRSRGMHMEALEVLNPQLVQLQLSLQQAAGPGASVGNGNGETPRQPPSGLAPAQIAGGPIA